MSHGFIGVPTKIRIKADVGCELPKFIVNDVSCTKVAGPHHSSPKDANPLVNRFCTVEARAHVFDHLRKLDGKRRSRRHAHGDTASVVVSA
ncbi:MAG: hypothetical protein WAV38_14720 [Xanthobacteraceae bacterium]